MLTIKNKTLSLTAALLSASFAMHSTALTLTDDFTSGPSAVWNKATWTNGSPFGCAFTNSASYLYPASSGMVFKSDKDYCAEMFTGNNYTYGTLETVMSVSNVPGTVGSAFLISGGSGSTSPWEEIDVEVLPSFPGRVHFAVIYQAYNGGNWGTAFGEKIYDTYAVNPVPIGTGGAYKVVWSTTNIKFYAGGNLLWTVTKGTGSPTCATTVSGTTASPNCYIPAAQWPVSNKSIRLNAWSGDGSAWPGPFNNSSTAYTWYDYVYYK